MSRIARYSFFLLALAIPSSAQVDPVGIALQTSFIWPSWIPDPTTAQAYVAFRQNFSLQGFPWTAQLHIFADSRYWLWLNGAYILRGPCRFNPKRPEYDTSESFSIDVTSLVSSGSNSLVVLAHHYGAGVINGRIMSHIPGLTVLLVADNETVAQTSPSWRCSNETEYGPSPGAWSSIPDVIDARAPVVGWTAPDYDDSTWGTADPVNGSLWGALFPRAVPLAVEAALPFAALTLLPSGTPLAAALPLTLVAGQSIVVDLGRMAMVYADIELYAPSAGAVLNLDYALRYVHGTPHETYGAGSTLTTRAGSQRLFGGDQWASHYMIVNVQSGNITIVNITLVSRSYPFDRLGAFQSSDAQLTSIWERAVNTLAVVSDDAYGSDARERNEWLQDPAQPNFITTRVAFAGPPLPGKSSPAYSDGRLLRNLLRHAALSQLSDGRILATFPTDRGPEDCHYFIEDYACQFVEALRLYYDSTNDVAFLQETWPVIVQQLNWFTSRISTTGLLLAREYTSFDDPLAYIIVQGTALNAFLYKAYVDAAYIGTALGETAAAANYSSAAAALSDAINAQLWNSTEGTYNSGLNITSDGAAVVFSPTVHAAMIALQRGVVPSARMASTAAWFLQSFQRIGGFHVCSNPDYEAMIAERAGLNMTVVYYWAWKVLYALDTEDADALALSEMRRQWGNMLLATDIDTLWESFADSESCHNYGAVPAYFLSSYVIGVRVSGPVWAPGALQIEPRLGGLSAANGSVVTEYGVVNCSWARNTTVLEFTIHLPSAGSVPLRLADTNGTTLILNGEPTPTTMDGRYAVVSLVTPGVYMGSIAVL